VQKDTQAPLPAICIKLIGIRTDEEQQKVRGWVEEEGLQGLVELIPFMQRDELLSVMTECDLSVYPAFRDSGSMSVLEACSLGCPTICFDAGGQDAFPDDILIKVPVCDTYPQCVEAFAERLQWCLAHRDELTAIGGKSRQWVSENLTWDKKVSEFMRIYHGF
jgi:glycosyltransferase involved in cell wall biosynthesis